MKYRPLRERVFGKKGHLLGVPEPLLAYRDPILDMIPEGSTHAVEIGSCQGWFAYRIMRQSALTLWCVDPWKGEGPDGDGPYNRQCWEKNLRHWWNDGRVQQVAKTSAAGAAAWKRHHPDRKIDWIFIDGDHHEESVLRDLRLWEPLVRSGGLVSGHDYTGDWGQEVSRAVARYLKELRHRGEHRSLSHGFVYDYTGKGSSAECWWWYKP